MNNGIAAPDTDPDRITAENITTAIVTKGTNLAAVSEATGISYSTLRRSLHQDRADARSLTIPQLHKIAEALKVPAATLIRK